MNQVQDMLDFPIEVINDGELEIRFGAEHKWAKSSNPKPPLKKNALKRRRKAQKRARRQYA